MKQSETNFVHYLAKFAFTVGSTCLYIISLWIFFAAVWRIVIDVSQEAFTIYKLLDEVALVVFGIAVIDVSTYLMQEEVLKGPKKTPKEERRAFSKFGVIIVTALSLEGLVITIETAKTDLTKMIYPIVLFLSATLLLVGLGIYQKLNSDAEKG